ncbi:MAG: hypothetical protein AAGM04_10805, partial [Pseudomonadota bacterium]
MAGFEDLLRSALAKQDNPSASVRQRIYQSSRDALERMIQQRSDMSAQTVAVQRQQLEAAIVEVELSLAGAAQPPVQTPSQPTAAAPVNSPSPNANAPTGLSSTPAPNPVPTSSPAVVPEKRATPTPSTAAGAPAAINPGLTAPPEFQRQPTQSPVQSPLQNQMPSGGSVAPPSAGVVPPIPGNTPTLEEISPAPPQRRRVERDFDGSPMGERKPYAKMLFWTIILSGIGVSIWWLITFGPGLLLPQSDGSVPNPRPTTESRGSGATNEADWVAVFSADTNPENIINRNEGQVQLIQSDGRTFARITSNPGTDNRIRFVVPAGVMEQIKGRAATFEMTMQAVDGQQQFSVYCEFGAMGSCGRKRFEIDGRMQPF